MGEWLYIVAVWLKGPKKSAVLGQLLLSTGKYMATSRPVHRGDRPFSTLNKEAFCIARKGRIYRVLNVCSASGAEWKTFNML